MAEIITFPSSRVAAHEPAASEPDPSGLADFPGDAPAREQALDPRRSCIVEAPAGSGKTGLLMQRFLKLLADPETLRPESVLAITFTRKATAELRERVSAQLEAAAVARNPPADASDFERATRKLAVDVLERDRELGWDLLGDPRRLRIDTIDALCAEIAATLPLLSGSVARQPVDDATPLYREAAQRTLRQLGGPDRPLHQALETVLLHRDARLADVETLLASMLAAREQWAELVPLDRGSLSDEVLDGEVRLRLERTLETLVCAGLTRALKCIPEHALAELASLAHTYAREPGYKGGESPISLCHAHPGPPAAEAAHLDHWRALVGLLFTKGCGWRARFGANVLGFLLSKTDQARLQAVVAEVQCEPLREALEAVRCLPPAKYPDDQWRMAKALFRLLLHALAELRLLFSERGECDFTELSLAARQVLATHAADVAAASGVTLQHLLVDEMQDTSSAQYDLLTSLTQHWDGGSQTVFLVGDPKQSIYLFRQARVERFLRTTRELRLGDVPLTFLRLTTNFRSRPELVHDVNEDFGRLFAPPERTLAADSLDIPFVEASSARPSSSAASGVHWHTRIVASVRRSSEASISQQESGDGSSDRNIEDAGSAPTGLRLAAAEAAEAGLAGPGPGSYVAGAYDAGFAGASTDSGLSSEQQDAITIRHVVAQWQSTPHPEQKPWRIAVLGRTRAHLEAVAAEFRRSGPCGRPIPYRAVQVVSLAERQEVLDIFALARALHHLADRTAWWATLRAPWCGLGAADLLAIAASAPDTSGRSTVPQLLGQVPAAVSRTGAQFLARARPVLQAALEQAGRTPLAQLVEQTWLSLGGDRYLEVEQRSNVQRFLGLLADMSGPTHAFRPAELKDKLCKLYAEPTAHPGAVELMTIHGAKGLEWDVVLVPGLGRRGRPDAQRLLNWLELESGSEPSVLLAPIQARGDDKSPLYQWLDRAHTRQNDAEQKRMLYVACTRAREELHLFATATQGKEALFPVAGSLLKSCWAAAEPHFANGAREEASDLLVQPSTDAGLALAAAAEPVQDGTSLTTAAMHRYLPQLTRLPIGFDPAQRFREAAASRLPYIPAGELPREMGPARPEGSYAVRALGNVVHRFLEWMAARLLSTSVAVLQSELSSWLDRLTASLRSEGLAPDAASRGAAQALTLLRNTLADPTGIWLLSPRPLAASEQAVASAAGLLRVDRLFLAGPAPNSPGEDTLWIVDFKTSEPGGRSAERFAAEERATYGPQLARYAEALGSQTAGAAWNTVELGLYYPAIPRLIHWPPGSA